jgi:hypothetical protein
MRPANAELAAIAWLKTVPGLPVNQIGGELPQDNSTWAASGFVQPIIVGRGSSNIYYGYREPVVMVHCWAVNPAKETPPWWKANELAEKIYARLLKEDNGVGNLSIKTGYRNVRITQAWCIEEPKKIPWGFPSGQGSFVDPGYAAHYTLSFQMAWSELPE